MTNTPSTFSVEEGLKVKELIEKIIDLPDNTVVRIVDPMEWKKNNKKSWFNVEKIVYDKNNNLLLLI